MRHASAGLADHVAAHLVVLDQFVDAGVQAVERQLVAGQHEDVRRDALLERTQRAEIEPERIAIGLDRPDADIRADPGQHLVGGEEQPVRLREQHDLLRRVAVAGDEREVAAADPQRVAADHAPEGRR